MVSLTEIVPDRESSPAQLLQHAARMLLDDNGEPITDPVKVRIARSLILNARINLVLQAWKPTHAIGARE